MEWQFGVTDQSHDQINYAVKTYLQIEMQNPKIKTTHNFKVLFCQKHWSIHRIAAKPKQCPSMISVHGYLIHYTIPFLKRICSDSKNEIPFLRVWYTSFFERIKIKFHNSWTMNQIIEPPCSSYVFPAKWLICGVFKHFMKIFFVHIDNFFLSFSCISYIGLTSRTLPRSFEYWSVWVFRPVVRSPRPSDVSSS